MSKGHNKGHNFVVESLERRATISVTGHQCAPRSGIPGKVTLNLPPSQDVVLLTLDEARGLALALQAEADYAEEAL